MSYWHLGNVRARRSAKFKLKHTSVHPMTLPSKPERVNARVVEGGEVVYDSKDGIESLCSQCLQICSVSQLE